jgi:restriction system protein
MNAICWMPISILVLLAIKTYYESWQDGIALEKEGREKRDAFRVSILGDKIFKGWIRIRNHVEISGRWGSDNPILVILGVNESFSEEINYSELTGISVHSENTAFHHMPLLNLEVEKFSKKHIVKLKVVNPDDVELIKESISERLTELKRKVEVERIMQARYKTGDFKEISPYHFEKVIEELLTCMGYSVTRVGGSGDGGVDLRGRNSSTGEKIIVQCKRYKGNVGIGTIRDFYGAFIHSKSDKGFVITTSAFTKESINWIRDKPIELIDGKKLSQLMMKYYK